MVEGMIVLAFLFLLCIVGALGDYLAEKFNWLADEEETFDSIEQEQLCTKCKRKVS